MSAALRIISSSDPAKGIVIAEHVESLSSGLPELSTTLEFLKVLARARNCEASAEWEELHMALHSAGRIASNDDTLCKTLYEIAYDIAQKRASAGDVTTGRAVSSFIGSLPQTGVAPWTFHTQMARLDTSLMNSTAVQYHLANAAPHMESDRQAHDWASMAVWAASRAGESDEKGADMIRQLVAVMQKDEQQQILVQAVVNFAGDCISGFHPQKGEAFIQAIEDHAPARFFEKIAFLKAVANARSLLANEKNDKALSVLRLANQLAGMFPEYKESFYNISLDAAKQQLRMKDSKLALEYLEFLLSGPGKQIDHFRLNDDAAYLHALLGNFPDAKFHLLEAAAAADVDAKAKAWADRAWFVVDRCRDSAASSTLFNELKDVAPSAAKPRLIGLSLQGCRRLLVSNLWQKGAAVLGCIHAADVPSSETQVELQFLTHLSRAHLTAKEGDIQGSIAIFRNALSESADETDRVKDVLNAVVAQGAAKAQTKDYVSTDEYIEFIANDFPEKAGRFETHLSVSILKNNQARHYPAARQLLAAAARARTDQEWQRVIQNMSPLHWMKSWESALEIFNRLDMLAVSPQLKRGIALSKAGWLIHRGEVDEGRELVENNATTEHNLIPNLTRLYYSMTRAYLIAGRMEDAHDAFQHAELFAAAIDPRERETIFNRVFYGDLGGQRTFRLDELLAVVLRETQDKQQRGRFINLYCEAAGKVARPADAAAFLEEIAAGGEVYIPLRTGRQCQGSEDSPRFDSRRRCPRSFSTGREFLAMTILAFSNKETLTC